MKKFIVLLFAITISLFSIGFPLFPNYKVGAASIPFLTLPFNNPSVTITQSYSENIDTLHTGTDYASSNLSQIRFNVLAAAPGEILYAGQPSGWGGANVVVIKHTNLITGDGDWISLYLHLGSIVKSGGSVQRGELIGIAGNTGYVYPAPTADQPDNGVHLHFELIKGSIWNAISCIQTTSGTCRDTRDPYNPNLFGSGIPSKKCMPTTENNWIVTESCTLDSNLYSSNSLIVRNNATLYVNPGVILNILYFDVNILEGGSLILNNASQLLVPHGSITVISGGLLQVNDYALVDLDLQYHKLFVKGDSKVLIKAFGKLV